MFHHLPVFLVLFQPTFFGVLPAILLAGILYGRLSKAPERGVNSFSVTTGVKTFTSVLLSFLWVETYQYKYNVAIFNTYGINIWAFILWVCGCLLFLRVYTFVRSKVSHFAMAFCFSWLFYFSGLLVLEYIGYYVLAIRESSAKPGDALIFGLVHGTFGLHVYYVFFPAVILTIYHVLSKLSRYTGDRIEMVRELLFSSRYKARQ